MGTKVVHVEVVGKDGPALQKFYADVFGWTLDTNNPGGYGMYRQDDGLTGGIGATPDGGAGHVTFYVSTDDAQSILDRAVAAGGQVIMPLTEVAPETIVALFADPVGHVVGIM
jgi:predicted enzyme related to lactoylglutathione lyase